MIIQCGHCKTKYAYDENRFKRRPSKKIRCARCKKVFEIHNPAFQEKQSSRPSPSDDTAVGRTRPTPTVEPEENASDRLSNTSPSETPLHLPDDRRYSIAIIEGPEASSVFRLEKPRVVIGRSNADIVVNDSESSREHAVVEVRGALVLIEDMGSKNGTWIDGERIEGPVEIFNQTEFRIGGSTLMFIETASD